ncbi:MAG TPA: RES domain-containing protein, partial [Gemmatimonadaceae bacterium]|nr:RES domain-containing protein [Gemmatimonadaceae bacterium]
HPLFDGRGAALIGGRWNSPGNPVVYCGMTFAVCILEQLAHAAIGILPASQRWCSATVPKGVRIEEITPDDLPDWDSADLIASRAYGDAWIEERRTVALVVPSVVGRPVERNVVVNPLHPDFKRVSISESRPVIWEPRLRKRSSHLHSPPNLMPSTLGSI